jgi:D-3-phosphoglycerate dehydrogenase
MIDFEAMYRHKKCLGWTPGVNKRAVAELALCFMLTLLRKIQIANEEVSKGIWRQVIGGQLSGKTVGIVGCGNIGKDLISLLRPFQCKIYVHDIKDYTEFYSEHKIDILSLDELMSRVDVISLHVPLDEKTKNIINRRRIGLMKPTAVLINVARGGLVDEVALKEALISQSIAGAAFDVFSQEPPSDTGLINHPNFLATPHIGGSSVEAILAMGRAAIDGLDNFNEVVL